MILTLKIVFLLHKFRLRDIASFFLFSFFFLKKLFSLTHARLTHSSLFSLIPAISKPTSRLPQQSHSLKSLTLSSTASRFPHQPYASPQQFQHPPCSSLLSLAWGVQRKDNYLSLVRGV